MTRVSLLKKGFAHGLRIFLFVGGAGVLQRVCCRLVLLSLSVCLSSCLDCLFERAEHDFQMFFFWAGVQTSMFSVRRVSVRALSVLVFSALRFDRRGWGKGVPMRLVPHIAIVIYGILEPSWRSVVKACRCLWGENSGACCLRRPARPCLRLRAKGTVLFVCGVGGTSQRQPRVFTTPGRPNV